MHQLSLQATIMSWLKTMWILCSSYLRALDFFSLDIFFLFGEYLNENNHCIAFFCQQKFLELSGCEYMLDAFTQRFGIPFILISANIFFHRVSVLPHKCIIYLCIHQCNLLSPCYKI